MARKFHFVLWLSMLLRYSCNIIDAACLSKSPLSFLLDFLRTTCLILSFAIADVNASSHKITSKLNLFSTCFLKDNIFDLIFFVLRFSESGKPIIILETLSCCTIKLKEAKKSLLLGRVLKG